MGSPDESTEEWAVRKALTLDREGWLECEAIIRYGAEVIGARFFYRQAEALLGFRNKVIEGLAEPIRMELEQYEYAPGKHAKGRVGRRSAVETVGLGDGERLTPLGREILRVLEVRRDVERLEGVRHG